MTTTEPTTTTGPATTFESLAGRIDAAQRAISRLDAVPRAAADELVAAVEGHDAAVLQSLVTRLRADDRGRELSYEGCGTQQFYWPFGVAMIDRAFWVADTGNRRVLGWLDGLPEPGQGADVVLGQADLASRGENRRDRVEHDSLCWPYGLSYHSGRLAMADSGNNRVTVWGVEP